MIKRKLIRIDLIVEQMFYMGTPPATLSSYFNSDIIWFPVAVSLKILYSKTGLL